ncbi:MAG: alkaline phosphatase family protein, partial [Rikenellaceae bacterium]|nr:alkaline phosphatase family protein [Rikenellaceae bacterium]
MKFRALLILALLPFGALRAQTATQTAEQTKQPRLIINIVVSQMRYDFLSRFENGFGEGGFKRFMREGTSY